MEGISTEIRQKYLTVLERIQKAAQSAGRTGEPVRLVVVTKGQPASVIRAAVEAGVEILGENYPEETLQKIQEIGKLPGTAWHMIGHLQSRKAGIVADHFDMIHSLDSFRLARKLDALMAARGRVLPALLEFNVGGEESKHGWDAFDETKWDSLLPDVEQILALPNIAVQGLMTMPPYFEDCEQARPYFVKLRRLGEFLASRFSSYPGSPSFSEYSMGTSIDYEVAVQEGATYVRVGTAIVGPRPKKA
ncbi:MAG: YggS family pyridoxal phosphate-dependent enzyme [Chloroflexi bacterium]|nr:YggS family pyridoxal phosphate-dependent enzyme [Chloroflexota bacterium]